MRRKRFHFFLAFILGLILSSFLKAGRASSQQDPPAGEELIQAGRLLEEIRTLAGPEFEGRATGTFGGTRAADYIAQEFGKVGLKPLGDQRNYFQAFEVTTGTRLGKENRLTLDRSGELRSYRPQVSFIPFGYSDEGRFSGELAFVGYGITAPELNYDDYGDLDVKDKIVLVMTHEPQERNKQGPFRKAEAFRYTDVRYKVWNAREHGAKGIMIVMDPNNHAGEREELFAIRGGGSASAGIVSVNILREIAQAILSPAGKSLAEVQKEIDETLTPRSFLVPEIVAHLEVSLIREKGQAANVIGILPGRDPTLRDEAVVIGAHYDGLGRGGENSLSPARYGEIHPGADDNASGVAGVISLARAFTRSGIKRTLVFVAFSGEEMGLLGSSHYVKNPPWPIDKSYAMINLDMIGRLEKDRLNILGVDSAKEFRPLLQETAKGFPLKLTFSGDSFGPSDHTPFYAQGRPVLMFFTDPHSDYHRPSDTPDKINGEGLERIVRFIFRAASKLANQNEPLTFVRKEGDPPRIGRGERGGYGAYFGSIPDFSESSVPGLRLSGVRPGSPAEKIGLLAGDIIVKFGAMGIRNLQDLLFALRSRRPGDQVEVLYLRDGKELVGQATLEERR